LYFHDIIIPMSFYLLNPCIIPVQKRLSFVQNIHKTFDCNSGISIIKKAACCKSMYLWNKFVFIPYVPWIKRNLHIFSIFGFLLEIPISSSVSQIIKGLYSYFFRFLLLPSSILQLHHEEGNFFLEYVQSNWLFNAWYGLKASSSILFVQ